MTKKQTAKGTTLKKKASASGQDATTTFSTRLTAGEKELIERAAKIRKWTPSKLMRMASVERAANIVNIHESRLRRELEDLAVDIARQLWAPHLQGEDPSGNQPAVFIPHNIYDNEYGDVEPSSLKIGHLEQMSDGLLYGGVEFLAQIVRAGESHFEPPLPDPVDPTSLNESSGSGEGQ